MEIYFTVRSGEHDFLYKYNLSSSFVKRLPKVDCLLYSEGKLIGGNKEKLFDTETLDTIVRAESEYTAFSTFKDKIIAADGLNVVLPIEKVKIGYVEPPKELTREIVAIAQYQNDIMVGCNNHKSSGVFYLSDVNKKFYFTGPIKSIIPIDGNMIILNNVINETTAVNELAGEVRRFVGIATHAVRYNGNVIVSGKFDGIKLMNCQSLEIRECLKDMGPINALAVVPEALNSFNTL